MEPEPYRLRMESKAASSFRCFSLLLEAPVVVLQSLSKRLSCIGSESAHSFEVRMPKRRMGVLSHMASKRESAVLYITSVEDVGVGKVVW